MSEHHKNSPLSVEITKDNVLRLLPEQYRDAVLDYVVDLHTAKCTSKISFDDGDIDGELEGLIKPALVARDSLYRRLIAEPDLLGEYRREVCCHSTLYRADQPWTIAAALALRPRQDWDWDVVEAWSWVYRLATLENVTPDQFANWLDFQDPHASRKAVKAHLMHSGRVLPAQSLLKPALDGPAPSDA